MRKAQALIAVTVKLGKVFEAVGQKIGSFAPEELDFLVASLLGGGAADI